MGFESCNNLITVKVLENLLWHLFFSFFFFLHLVQIQQYQANKTVLLSRPSVSIRMNRFIGRRVIPRVCSV